MEEQIIAMLTLHPEGLELATIVAFTHADPIEVQTCLDKMVSAGEISTVRSLTNDGAVILKYMYNPK